MNLSQGEAGPDFGHDDRYRWEFGDDEDGDAEASSNTQAAAWADEEYQDEMDFQEYQLAQKRYGSKVTRRSTIHPPSKKRRVSERRGLASNLDAAKATDTDAVVEPRDDCCDEDDEEELPITRTPQVKSEAVFERESSRTQEPTPPPDQGGARETTEELYEVTPERRMEAMNIAANDSNQAEIQQEGNAANEGPDDSYQPDEEVDFELEFEKAEIEKNHQLKMAEIRAKQRALKRRRES